MTLQKPALLLTLLSSVAVAQPPKLEETVVTATRLDTTLERAPLAVSLVNTRDIHAGRQELGLDESLTRVPGLFMQNRYNFAQDLRVSIRGFGSRANFGIRGIKVIADGIPITLPDGQSGTDDLDIGSTERIEVIRGPAASLYGTASGGVISLTTEEAPVDPFFEAKITAGEYGHRRYQLKTGGRAGRLNYLVNASHLAMEGYRDHSAVEHRLINSRLRYDFSENARLTAIINAVDSPKAEDAGGITREEAAADPEQAQSRNTSSNAGESFDQQRLGLVYEQRLAPGHDLTLRGYSLWKDFGNFLPIGSHIPFVADDGVVEYQREFFGGGARYTWSQDIAGRPNSLTLGVDMDMQRDDRQRYINDAGIRGERVFDQREKADSLGIYFRDELQLGDTWHLSLGGRFDRLDLSVDDRYLSNGDQSGELDFDEFSPTAALLWNPSPRLSAYINYATAFETPTFTELGAPAQELEVSLGGFADVRAQKARSFEIGARGILAGRIYYDLALYTMTVDDEVTNVVNIGNRAFFENADTDRQGLEAQIQAEVSDSLDLTVTYTYSDFTFDRFDGEPDAEGQWLPGIPRNQLFAELAYTHNSGLFVAVDALYVGKLYVDNANFAKVDSYWITNLRAGRKFRFGETTVTPFFGVNNLLDESYFSNVRINAFGGRAFEPAPERHVYGGVTLRF